MNILLVSQCRKNALKETRRILDQFAERRGERTWQTPITRAGLDTLRKLLRRRARKNTAVACHWIRGHNHSELLWVVGDASQFNARGGAPTNTTQRNVLRKGDENDWHSAHLIHLLASLAALFHDLGKACRAFQMRLHGQLEGRNRYRHEWISLRLLEAFVGNDDDATWLARLESLDEADDSFRLANLRRDGIDALDDDTLPFRHLPPLAAAVGWLILSHHRLPAMPAHDDDGVQKWSGARPNLNTDLLPRLPEDFSAAWNERVEPAALTDITPYWEFPHGLPVTDRTWRERAQRLARQLQRLSLETPPLSSPFVMHLARLALMLGDHHYSSLTDNGRLSGFADGALYANTTVKEGTRQLCQPLIEHLLGVTRSVGEITHRLPDMASALPRIARHKGFKARSRDARFRWQDKAYDLACGLRESSREHGFFGVNLASTGCGKTIANGRILYALADPDEGARFSIALGLRTLTLQTGQAYRERLGLGSDDLAIRVGGSDSRALFEHLQREQGGSDSRDELLDEQTHVHFEGNAENHPLLGKVIHDPNARSLISAPVLVCTIDHLIPATESLRGGRQIAPMLRLMSGDLILDEPDDFGLDDLPALTRLVYWSGLLGSRVLLSSATLAPAIVRGLFEAYREGRAEYQRHRGKPGLPVDPVCAWFDESECVSQRCADDMIFKTAHQSFIERRQQRLADLEPRRRGKIVPFQAASTAPEDIARRLAELILEQSRALHDCHHTLDPRSGKRVSFGLVRMANIEPLVKVAQALYTSDTATDQRIHLCVYHSQFPLLLRSRLEARLDRALDRRDPEAVLVLPDIRQRLDANPESEQLFIVLGSPVTEVGRDHDYDWAIVEPSSMRSIIQLAGRVRRHRSEAVDEPNIALLSTNVKHLARQDAPFSRPGFEYYAPWQLSHHDLDRLLRPEEWQSIDSRPRLQAATNNQPRERLVDLEHARLAARLLPAMPPPVTTGRRRRGASAHSELGAFLFFRHPHMTLCATMLQHYPFRRSDGEEIELVLLPNEDETDFMVCRREREGREVRLIPVESQIGRVTNEAIANPRVSAWNEPDYMEALNDQADAMELSLERCAKRFGSITLKTRNAAQGWDFHPALGFVRRQ